MWLVWQWDSKKIPRHSSLRESLGMTWVLLFTLQCGTKNQAETYVDKDPEEKARIALNAGDYDTGIEILEPLCETQSAGESDEKYYSRFPLLASAYAAKAGIDLLGILKQNGSSGGGSGFLSQLDGFIPAAPTEDEVATLKKGITLMNSMPDEYRDEKNAEITYAKSVAFQLLLYQSAYSIMYMKLFLSVNADGSIDLAKLSEMSVEDAANILSSLLDASNAAGDNPQGEALKEKMNEAISSIDSQDGADDRERLMNYMQNSRS